MKSLQELEEALENARGGQNTGDIEAAVADLEDLRARQMDAAKHSILNECHALLDCVSNDDHLTVSGLDEFDRDSLSSLGQTLYDLLDRHDFQNGLLEDVESDLKNVHRALHKVADAIAKSEVFGGKKII